MPSVNITLTKNALPPESLRDVVRQILKVFVELHGAPRTRELRSEITSARVIEIEASHFCVGGDIAERPRYEIEFVTFQDVLDPSAKRQLVEKTTSILRSADSVRLNPTTTASGASSEKLRMEIGARTEKSTPRVTSSAGWLIALTSCERAMTPDVASPRRLNDFYTVTPKKYASARR